MDKRSRSTTSVTDASVTPSLRKPHVKTKGSDIKITRKSSKKQHQKGGGQGETTDVQMAKYLVELFKDKVNLTKIYT